MSTQVNTDICPDCGGAIHALPPCGAPHHAGCACSVAQREAEIHCLRMQRNAARTERDRLDRILRLTTAAAMGLDDYKERPFMGTVDFMENLPSEVHGQNRQWRAALAKEKKS